MRKPSHPQAAPISKNGQLGIASIRVEPVARPLAISALKLRGGNEKYSDDGGNPGCWLVNLCSGEKSLMTGSVLIWFIAALAIKPTAKVKDGGLFGE